MRSKMKFRSGLFIILGVFLAIVAPTGLAFPLAAAEPYPPFDQPPWPKGLKEQLYDENPEADVVKAMFGHDWKKEDALVRPPLELCLQTLNKYLPEPDSQDWPIVSPEGRMPLPRFLIQREIWSADVWVFQYYPGVSDTENKRRYCYSRAWWYFSHYYAEAALAMMAKDAARETVSTTDILRWAGSRNYWPGDKLGQLSGVPLSEKKTWQILHSSKNPCYRLIALEYFDSVNQTPEEVLQLYRECLFHTCSYMEERAMNKMFFDPVCRPEEILALLREYLDSKPLENDGTRGGHRSAAMGRGPEAFALQLIEKFEAPEDKKSQGPAPTTLPPMETHPKPAP